jgi:hypothetical protein
MPQQRRNSGRLSTAAWGHKKTHAVQQKTFYSITSSALASSMGGMVRPSARAVRRLITKSNLVDCTTGRSIAYCPSGCVLCRSPFDDTLPSGWSPSSSGRRQGMARRQPGKLASARVGAAPIVFITAHADQSFHPRLLERGAVACPAMSPLRAAVGIEVLADVLELAQLRSEILRVRGPAESEPGADRQRYNCLELHCRSLPELQWLCVGAACMPLRSFRMDLKCGAMRIHENCHAPAEPIEFQFRAIAAVTR